MVLGVGGVAYGAWSIRQGLRALPARPPPVESHDPPPEEPATRTSAGGLMYGMTARYHGGWLLGWGLLVVLVGLYLVYAGLAG